MTKTRAQAQGGVGGSWGSRSMGRSQIAGRNASQAFVYKTLKQLDHEARNGRPRKPPQPLAIRPITIDDASYVIDSWARSYRRSPTTGAIEDDVFKVEQRARIDRLICRSKCFVACETNDRTLIRGWVCFEPGSDTKIPVVHYICVQPSAQMSGIGSALVSVARRTASDPDAFMWATHETAPMRHIRPKWNLLYNPYLLEVKA